VRGGLKQREQAEEDLCYPLLFFVVCNSTDFFTLHSLRCFGSLKTIRAALFRYSIPGSRVHVLCQGVLEVLVLFVVLFLPPHGAS